MNEGQATALELNGVSRKIINAAMTVHKKLGPGLLEGVYRECLVYELQKSGLRVEVEVQIPILYDGIPLKSALRVDVLVEGEVIVELKSIEDVHPVHKAQVISYLRLSGKRLGLLFNFNVVLLKDGMFRFVNKF